MILFFIPELTLLPDGVSEIFHMKNYQYNPLNSSSFRVMYVSTKVQEVL